MGRRPYSAKPCRRCGGEKPPGKGRAYCDPCVVIAAAETAARARLAGLKQQREQRDTTRKCLRCGGPKSRGQAKRYCDACRVEVDAEIRERDRQRASAYYLRTRVLTGRKPRGPDWVEEDRGYATPCHIWQHAFFSETGYGLARRSRHEPVGAHVLAYERKHGPVPKGWHIDHLCRVRACVNADHMEVVTCAENSRRGDNAKLTYDDVAEIRRLLAEGGLLQREIAALFGVNASTIGDIKWGRTWVAPGGALAA